MENDKKTNSKHSIVSVRIDTIHLFTCILVKMGKILIKLIHSIKLNYLYINKKNPKRIGIV